MRYDAELARTTQLLRDACNAFLATGDENSFLQAASDILKQRGVGEKVLGNAVVALSKEVEDVALLRLLIRIK